MPKGGKTEASVLMGRQSQASWPKEHGAKLGFVQEDSGLDGHYR